MGNREEDVDDVLHDPSSPNALREQTSQAEQARLKLAETMAEASEVIDAVNSSLNDEDTRKGTRETSAEIFEDVAGSDHEKDEAYEADFEEVVEIEACEVPAQSEAADKPPFGRITTVSEEVSQSNGAPLNVEAQNAAGEGQDIHSGGQDDSRKPLFGRTITLISETEVPSRSAEMDSDKQQVEYVPDFEEDLSTAEGQVVETAKLHEYPDVVEAENRREEARMPVDTSAASIGAMEPSVKSNSQQETNYAQERSLQALNISDHPSDAAKVYVEVPRTLDEDPRPVGMGERSNIAVSDKRAKLAERVAEHKALAELLLSKGEGMAAVEELSEVINLMPQDPIGHSMRATAFLQAGKAVEAIKDLQNASNLDPGDAKMFLRLAHLCIGTGDLESGLQAIRAGHAAHPTNTELVHLLNEYSLSPVKEWLQSHVPDSEIEGEASTSWAGHQKAGGLGMAIDRPHCGEDFKWQRKTFTGKFYTPITSSMRTIEARQRKIREKCVQLNRKKEQKLVGQRKKLQVAAAEEARIAKMESDKAQVIRQLDIVHDCLQIIHNEKLIQYGKPPASSAQRRMQRSMPRFTQSEDVVAEILLYLDREIPMDRDPRGYEHPSAHLERRAEIVQDVINHVTALSMQPVKVHRPKERSATLAQLFPPTPSASKQGLLSPSMSDVTVTSPLSSASNAPDPCSPGKLPDIWRRSSTVQRSEFSAPPSGQEETPGNISPFERRGSTAAAKVERKISGNLTSLPETMVERISSLASQTSQRSTSAVEEDEVLYSTGEVIHIMHPSLDAGGARTPMSPVGTRAGTRAGRSAETSVPSYTKLPMKTHSSSLSHACGLATRGGFL